MGDITGIIKPFQNRWSVEKRILNFSCFATIFAFSDSELNGKTWRQLGQLTFPTWFAGTFSFDLQEGQPILIFSTEF